MSKICFAYASSCLDEAPPVKDFFMREKNPPSSLEKDRSRATFEFVFVASFSAALVELSMIEMNDG